MKQKANVNVYLLLVKEDQILLSFRQNTGYEDEKWSLLSGHVESNESAIQAMVREAQEEIGIHIEGTDLKVVHVMHRKTDRENIDIFMMCTKWAYEVMNKEPEKCGGLKFFDFNNMPKNIIKYVENTLLNIKNNVFFSESGFDS